MDAQNQIVSKLCSFYVSDWHLVTMLLPYINKKINEEIEIATILEKNIENNIKTLVERLNLKNEEKILNINWKNANEKKYSNLCKMLEKEKNKDILIIVNGTKEYVNNVNKNINKIIEKNIDEFKKENRKIKIIDCYEIVEFNGSIVEILDNHDKILNTAGEKEINEVFEDYNRSEKIV
jgi:hypothetical protein